MTPKGAAGYCAPLPTGNGVKTHAPLPIRKDAQKKTSSFDF